MQKRYTEEFSELVVKQMMAVQVDAKKAVS
jgi:hypothetical protein